jgi:hypothetical protein
MERMASSYHMYINAETKPRCKHRRKGVGRIAGAGLDVLENEPNVLFGPVARILPFFNNGIPVRLA